MQRISFIVTMVVVVGIIFVSACRTTAPRKMAAVTDKAVMPIFTAGKRWDTTTPSAPAPADSYRGPYSTRMLPRMSQLPQNLPMSSTLSSI